MNYDVFEPAYEAKQTERLEKSFAQAAGVEVRNGLKIPDSESLIIGDGRRLQVAVMFLDICHFTSRLLNSETEQKNALKGLNLFFTEMVRIAEDYGGTVEKNTGDGLMAYFEEPGDSTSPDTACKRAVSCGLTMFRTVQRLIDPRLSRFGVVPFDFRIGIDYGPLTIAKMGAPRRFNSIVAVGITANIASKMLAFGRAGEIIIGDWVKDNLPEEWKRLTSPLEERSGFTCGTDQKPYLFYKYLGRWK